MYAVFEPLLCCLKAIWMHPYTITPTKLAPDLGIQVHLWSENDAIKRHVWGWYPPQTTSHRHIQMGLSHWYAVSRPQVCTLIIVHQISWPQIWEFRFFCGVKMMSLALGHVWGWYWYPPQTAPHIHIRYMYKYKVFEPLICCLMGI